MVFVVFGLSLMVTFLSRVGGTLATGFKVQPGFFITPKELKLSCWKDFTSRLENSRKNLSKPNERLAYKLVDVVLKNRITKFFGNCIFVLEACVLSNMLPMV